MSWFRSSRRRHSVEQPPSAAPAEEPLVSQDEPAEPPPPALRADELQGKPLADLHELAWQAGIPRYRLLRREPEVVALFYHQTLRVERLLLPARLRFVKGLRRRFRKPAAA